MTANNSFGSFISIVTHTYSRKLLALAVHYIVIVYHGKFFDSAEVLLNSPILLNNMLSSDSVTSSTFWFSQFNGAELFTLIPFYLRLVGSITATYQNSILNYLAIVFSNRISTYYTMQPSQSHHTNLDNVFSLQN